MECSHQDKLNIANGRIEWCKYCGALKYLDWDSDTFDEKKEWHYPSYGFGEPFEPERNQKLPRIFKALFFRDIPIIGFLNRKIVSCGEECCEFRDNGKNRKYIPANKFLLFRLYCKIASIIFRERVCTICGKRVSRGACVDYID